MNGLRFSKMTSNSMTLAKFAKTPKLLTDFRYVAAFAVFFSYLCSSASAEECSNSRQVFLLDRTSELNEAERSAFAAGIKTLFADDEFGGEIVIGEVRGSSLSSEWIFRTCVPANFEVTPACEEYFDSVNPSREEEEGPAFLEAPLQWLEVLLFGDDEREFSNAERISCQQERAAFDGQRAEHQAKALQAVQDVASEDVATSQTALAETVFRALETQCIRAQCQLFVFSNLLDNNWQQIILEESGHRAMGERVVQDAPFFDPANTNVKNVMVWGFGFDERNGENKTELDVQAALRLQQYWSGFFDEIATGSVSIHFEMPR